MTSALERLVERTLANGEISDKEQNVLIAKAHALGIGVDELDVIIWGQDRTEWHVFQYPVDSP